MLRVVVLVAFLVINCNSDCNFDIEKLRCWCRDKSSKTIFRIEHEKGFDGNWSIEYMPSEDCTAEDVINVLPGDWFQKNQTEDINDPDEDREWLDKGYELVGDSYYKIYTYGQYWEKARLTCVQEGSHLAVINSFKEALYLRALLRKSSSNIEHVQNKLSAFIGFHDIFEEGEYLTIFGQPLEHAGYNIWTSNKPKFVNIYDEGTGGEDCGGLHEDGKLIDLGCDWHYAFICERENRDTSCDSYIDYSRGAFKGVETVVEPPSGTRPRTEPGIGYKFYPGFAFFRYITTMAVWYEALFRCEREGAYLATPTSREKVELLHAISQLVDKSFLSETYYPGVHTGHHSFYRKDRFVTIFNESIDYKLFRQGNPGDPDNRLATEGFSGENCGSLSRTPEIIDIHCIATLPFMCEKPLNIP